MNVVPVSKIKIESKLAIIRESLAELELFVKQGEEAFLSDKKNSSLTVEE